MSSAWPSLLVVAAVGLIVAVQCRRVAARQVRLFAWCYGVAMSPPSLGLIAEYLTYQRRLRALLGGAALLLPALVPWAVGGRYVNPPLSFSFTSFLWGIGTATVWGEYSFARPAPAPGAPRAALLDRRNLSDYLPRPWLWAPIAGGALAVVAWGVVPFLPAGEASSLDIAAGVTLGVVVPPLVLGLGTFLVRRPQPVVSPGLVDADDAVRAASVRALATVGTTIVLLGAVEGLMLWAPAADGAGDLAVGTLALAVVVLAFASWSARSVWSRARRPAARPRPLADASGPVTA